MSVFFALKGLAMIYRGAQTLEYHTGGFFGAVGTPHLGDLNRKIAEDFKYDDVGEVLVDLAGLTAGGAAAKAGIKPAILATIAARRVVQERLGAVTKTFLGIIPKSFLPVAEATGALGEEVLDMVGAALDVGNDLLGLASGLGDKLPDLALDTVGFVRAAFEVYEEGSEIISSYVEGFQKQFGTAEGLAAAAVTAVDAFLFPFQEQKRRAGETQRGVDAVNEAIGSFLLDLAHGFADLTNPILQLLHVQPPLPGEPPGPPPPPPTPAHVLQRRKKREETRRRAQDVTATGPLTGDLLDIQRGLRELGLVTNLPALTHQVFDPDRPSARGRTRIPFGQLRELIAELKRG